MFLVVPRRGARLFWDEWPGPSRQNSSGIRCTEADGQFATIRQTDMSRRTVTGESCERRKRIATSFLTRTVSVGRAWRRGICFPRTATLGRRHAHDTGQAMPPARAIWGPICGSGSWPCGRRLRPNRAVAKRRSIRGDGLRQCEGRPDLAAR